MRFPLVLILVFLPSLSSPAQQRSGADSLRDERPAYLLNDVIVTGLRVAMPLASVPFGATILGGDALKSMPRGVALDEPLRLVPGVKVDNQANGSRIHLSIRGQGILTERGIRGIRLVLDGMPLNDPSGFAPDAFDLDYRALSRVEVLRGPAASVYGASASGGVIVLTTEEAPQRPLFAETSASAGSNDFRQAGARIGGSNENANYWLSFNRSVGAGYRDHTHFWGDNVYGRAEYAPSDAVRITPVFAWSDTYHENPEGINLQQYQEDERQANPDAIPYNEYLESNRVSAGVTASIRYDDANEFRLAANTRRTLFTEANNHTFTHRTLVNPSASAQYTLRSGSTQSAARNTLGIGADAGWQSIDEHRNDNLHSVEGDTVRSSERIEQRSFGVFAFDKLDLGRAWSVLASLRYDRISNSVEDRMKIGGDLSGDADFSRATARLGLSYALLPELSLYSSWGQGFLPPATEELAQNPDHFGGFNTHLAPALSNSVEVGARGGLLAGLQHDVTVFYLATDNDFDRYRITDPLRNQETFYRNSGSSKRWGVEFSLNARPADPVELRLAYTWSHFRYANSEPLRVMMDDPSIEKYILSGNALPNCPEHQLAFDAEWHILPYLTAGASAEALSKAWIDGANVESEAVPGYALVHARLVWTWEAAGIGGEASLALRNIGNVKYVAFSEPDPGGNAYQPGARREIIGSLRVRL